MSEQNDTTKESRWNRFIDNNLLTLILGGAVVFSGFNSSDAVTNSRLATLTEGQAEIRQGQIEVRQRLDRLISRQQCQATTVERLSDRAGIRSTCAMQE